MFLLLRLFSDNIRRLLMLPTRENTRACGLGQAAPQADSNGAAKAAHDQAGAACSFHHVVSLLTTMDLREIGGDAAA